MKQILLCVLLITGAALKAQIVAKAEAESPFPQYRVKVNLFNQAAFSLPLFKVSGEMLIGSDMNPLYVQADLGYNYYSQDELVKASGLHAGLRLNHYRPLIYRTQNMFSYGFFYQRSAINDYLKVNKEMPGFGEYSEYEKMKYHKERYGFNIEFMKQFPVYGKLFLEYGFGGGVMMMRTVTPDRVSQESFVNGLYREKEVITPSIGFSVKLGYALM